MSGDRDLIYYHRLKELGQYEKILDIDSFFDCVRLGSNRYSFISRVKLKIANQLDAVSGRYEDGEPDSAQIKHIMNYAKNKLINRVDSLAGFSIDDIKFSDYINQSYFRKTRAKVQEIQGKLREDALPSIINPVVKGSISENPDEYTGLIASFLFVPPEIDTSKRMTLDQWRPILEVYLGELNDINVGSPFLPDGLWKEESPFRWFIVFVSIFKKYSANLEVRPPDSPSSTLTLNESANLFKSLFIQVLFILKMGEALNNSILLRSLACDCFYAANLLCMKINSEIKDQNYYNNFCQRLLRFNVLQIICLPFMLNHIKKSNDMLILEKKETDESCLDSLFGLGGGLGLSEVEELTEKNKKLVKLNFLCKVVGQAPEVLYLSVDLLYLPIYGLTYCKDKFNDFSCDRTFCKFLCFLISPALFVFSVALPKAINYVMELPSLLLVCCLVPFVGPYLRYHTEGKNPLNKFLQVAVSILIASLLICLIVQSCGVAAVPFMAPLSQGVCSLVGVSLATPLGGVINACLWYPIISLAGNVMSMAMRYISGNSNSVEHSGAQDRSIEGNNPMTGGGSAVSMMAEAPLLEASSECSLGDHGLAEGRRFE